MLILDADRAYAAGFFDGEGCILLRERTKEGRKPSIDLRVEVANNHRAVLDWFVERWGGSVILATITKAGNNHYQWR